MKIHGTILHAQMSKHVWLVLTDRATPDTLS